MKQLKIGLIGYAHAHVISNARSFAQLGDSRRGHRPPDEAHRGYTRHAPLPDPSHE